MIYGLEYKISIGCAKVCTKMTTRYRGIYKGPDTDLQTCGSQWVAGYGRGTSQQGDRTGLAGIDLTVRLVSKLKMYFNQPEIIIKGQTKTVLIVHLKVLH